MVVPPRGAHEDDLQRLNGLNIMEFGFLKLIKKRREGKCGFD